MNELSSIEPIVRLIAFATSVVLLIAGERLLTCREPRRLKAYVANLALFATNTALLRVVATSSLVGLAVLSQAQGWGLLALTALPGWLAFIIAFVALDLVLYVQHRAYHWLPLLWRLHRVHHSDLDFDLSTGLRFHPGEMIISFAIKAAAVVALGASPLAVLCFEIVLNASSLFTHANMTLPARLDAALRGVLVTPAMHRIHHSVKPDEHNRNFGFFLSFWDRTFASYRARPQVDDAEMPIGLTDFRDPEERGYLALLKQPLLTTNAEASQ